MGGTLSSPSMADAGRWAVAVEMAMAMAIAMAMAVAAVAAIVSRSLVILRLAVPVVAPRIPAAVL